MDNFLTFEFENLHCILQDNKDTILVPEKKMKISLDKIKSFFKTNISLNVGYNDKGEECKIYELNGFIHIGCISVLKSNFENQLKSLNKKIKNGSN